MSKRTSWAGVGCVGLTLVLLFVMGGCQDYFFTPKIPETIKESNVIVPAAEPIPADILFVVDDSCSMEDEQTRLANNFQSFINEVVGSGDYRIAVVSTDVSAGSNDQVGNRNSVFGPAPYMSLRSISEDGCSDSGIAHGCFRGPGALETRVINASQPASEQVQLFQQNVRLGSCGDGQFESGLSSMRLALQSAGDNGCNAGFLRPEANLVVIFVADEDDIDPRDPDTPLSDYVNFLKQLKGGSAAQIRLAAIVGAKDGEASRCRNNGDTCGDTCQMPPPMGSGTTGCANNANLCDRATEYCDNDVCTNRDRQYFDSFCFWCSYYLTETCCSALAGTRYLRFLRLMEQEVAAADPSISVTGCRTSTSGTDRVSCLIDSVCQDDFSGTLQRIARDLLVTTDYVLDPPACNPQGVVVKLRKKSCQGDEASCVRALEYGEGFTVSDDGVRLQLKTSPGADEDVQIFFVTETNDCNPN